MSEIEELQHEQAIGRIRAAALRTGGYSRSVLHSDLVETVLELDNLATSLQARDRELAVYKAWAEALNFEGLHKYQHSREDHHVRPDPGGSILDWAAAEMLALRALLTQGGGR